MPECPHVNLMVQADHLECLECHEREVPLTISGSDLLKFLTVVEGIVEGLDMAGMTDTAKMLQERAGQLVLNHQLVWRTHGD